MEPGTKIFITDLWPQIQPIKRGRIS